MKPSETYLAKIERTDVAAEGPAVADMDNVDVVMAALVEEGSIAAKDDETAVNAMETPENRIFS